MLESAALDVKERKSKTKDIHMSKQTRSIVDPAPFQEVNGVKTKEKIKLNYQKVPKATHEPTVHPVTSKPSLQDQLSLKGDDNNMFSASPNSGADSTHDGDFEHEDLVGRSRVSETIETVPECPTRQTEQSRPLQEDQHAPRQPLLQDQLLLNRLLFGIRCLCL